MNRLLVLRLSALGDVIHTIPAVVALRDALPETRLVWVVENAYRELVELVAGVETIPVRMKKWGSALIASRREMRTALRAIRTADASVDFQGLIKSASLAWLSGAKTRYGFERDAIREKPASWFVNRPVRVDQSRHVIDWNLQLAEGIAPGKLKIAPADVDFSPFAHDPKGNLARYAGSIVLLPGAGKANKQWPTDRFAAMAKQLGDRALAVWGPGEKELAEAIGCRVAPPTSLRELAWLLRHAEVVVGGDTGPLHLAAALGTKVAGLYGPTSPRRNGPYGQASHVIDKNTSTKLIESISVGEAMTLLEQVMGE